MLLTAAESTAPWWGSGVFVAGAALITASFALLVNHLNRRAGRKEAERTMRRDSVVSLMSSMHALLGARTRVERDALLSAVHTAMITCLLVNPQLHEDVNRFYEKGRKFAAQEEGPGDSQIATNYEFAENELMMKVGERPKLYGLPKFRPS